MGYEIWDMEDAIRNMEYGIWHLKYEIWNIRKRKHEQWNVRYGMSNVKYGLWNISHNTKQIMFCLCLRWLGLGLGGLEPEAGWELGGGANMKKLYNFEYIWYTKILEYLFDKYRQIYIQACVS